MERSNQPPKTECCREEAQVPEATEATGPNDLLEAYTGKLTGRKYRGYWNYYGVRGNSKSWEQCFQQTRQIRFPWLNRRSQKKSYTGRGFERLLRRFQIPHPWIVEREAVPIRRDPMGVEAALGVLFRRYNHSPSGV
jgi:hypothetical protein